MVEKKSENVSMFGENYLFCKNSEQDGKNSGQDGKNSEQDGKNSEQDGKNSEQDGKNSEQDARTTPIMVYCSSLALIIRSLF